MRAAKTANTPRNLNRPAGFSPPANRRFHTQMPRSLIAGASVLALALALALLSVPAPAHAARGMEFALQDDAVFLDERWMPRETGLDHAVDLRATRIRANVMWSRLLVSNPESHTPRRSRSMTSRASTRCTPRRRPAASSSS